MAVNQASFSSCAPRKG
jgi:hypothetical protein